MASSVLTTVSPKYAAELSAGGTTIGALMVAYTLAACFTRIIWGQLSNVVGRVAVMYIGVILGGIATIILLLKGSILLYFMSRIIFGMGFSAVVTAGATLSTEVVERKSLSKAIAIYGLGGVLAQGIAPPLALMMYRYGIKAIVLTVCLLLGLCFVSNWLIKYSFKRKDTYKGRIFESRAVPMSAVAGIITFSTAGIFSFVPILTTLGQVDNVSGFFIANSVGLLFSRLLFSKINKKIPTNKLYSIGLAVFILSFLGITIAQGEAIITFSGLLYGLGRG
ncbi:MAG: MFS transporter, partial [Oscillospiraceae bacterium]